MSCNSRSVGCATQQCLTNSFLDALTLLRSARHRMSDLNQSLKHKLIGGNESVKQVSDSCDTIQPMAMCLSDVISQLQDEAQFINIGLDTYADIEAKL